MAYYKTLKLEDTQRVYSVVSADTGEITVLKNSILPDDKIMFSNGGYNKVYTHTLNELNKHLTPYDKAVILKMISSLNFVTNEIIPIDDNRYTYILADFFGLSRAKTVESLSNLYNLGVYKRVSDLPKDYNDREIRYWVFNPYISSSGKLLDKKMVNLFNGWELPR